MHTSIILVKVDVPLINDMCPDRVGANNYCIMSKPNRHGKQGLAVVLDCLT